MNTGKKFKAIAAMILGLAIAGCGGGGGGNDDSSNAGTPSSPSGEVSSQGIAYLSQAYQTAQSQAQQAEIATQKSENADVTELAQQVNDEAAVVSQQIITLSESDNLTINTSLTSEQQTQISNLDSLSGDELDRTYVRNLAASLKQLLAVTSRQVRAGEDTGVKQNAVSNVLRIEQSLVAAEQVLFVLEPSEYLLGAYEDSLLEIELGQVALESASSEEVREFAQQMIDEHTQLNADLTTLAAQKNLTLPAELGLEKQEVVAMISAFTEADFDRAYMDRNVLQHAEDISKTTVVAEQSSDAEIRALAAQALPVLQEHFEQAQTIAAGIQASALYQLAQGLASELQLAQIAQVRDFDDRIQNLGETIVQQNEAGFTQIVETVRQQNTQIPIIIPPAQVQAALQLLEASGTGDEVIETLINAQLAQSLQIAQSLQADSESDISSIAQIRLEALQNISENGGEETANETPDAGSATGTGDSGTADAGGDEGGTGGAVADGGSASGDGSSGTAPGSADGTGGTVTE